GDVGAQRCELRLTRDHVGPHRHLVVVVENAAAADGEHDERADLGVPRQRGKGQFHDLATRAYRGNSVRPLKFSCTTTTRPSWSPARPAPLRPAAETRP